MKQKELNIQFNGEGGPESCSKKVAQILERYRLNLKIFSEIYKINLPDLFRDEDKKSCQAAFSRHKFLTSGLLDSLFSGSPHPYLETIECFSERTKFVVASTIVSFKKTLPCVCQCMMEGLLLKHRELMLKPCDLVEEDFLLFIDREVGRMFGSKWDKYYEKYVKSQTKCLSSCQESRVKTGGVHNGLKLSHEEFVEKCLHYEDLTEDNPIVEATIVQDRGKARVITINKAEHNLLKPLHKNIYDHLSKQPWLLRGDCNEKSLSSFYRSNGESYVSADYESATDNFNPIISERILRAILLRTQYIPNGIRSMAVKSLHSEIKYPETPTLRGADCIVKPVRGQLMGNLLSFPILCLYNYLCLKYITNIPDRKIRINGDDLLASMKIKTYLRWASKLESLGMKLSSGKTAVHRRFASLNSTYFFRGKDGKLKILPCIRFGMLMKPLTNSHLETARNFYYFYQHMPKEYHKRARRQYILQHKRFLLGYGRSFTLPEPAGLNIRLNASELKSLDLLFIEKKFIEFTPRDRISRIITPNGNNFKTPESLMRVDCPYSEPPIIQEVVQEFVKENWATKLDLKGSNRFDLYNRDVKRSSLFNLYKEHYPTQITLRHLKTKYFLSEGTGNLNAIRKRFMKEYRGDFKRKRYYVPKTYNYWGGRSCDDIPSLVVTPAEEMQEDLSPLGEGLLCPTCYTCIRANKVLKKHKYNKCTECYRPILKQ